MKENEKNTHKKTSKAAGHAFSFSDMTTLEAKMGHSCLSSGGKGLGEILYSQLLPRCCKSADSHSSLFEMQKADPEPMLFFFCLIKSVPIDFVLNVLIPIYRASNFLLITASSMICRFFLFTCKDLSFTLYLIQFMCLMFTSIFSITGIDIKVGDKIVFLCI